MLIHAAYGSVKDISVYASVGVQPHQIYTVGKHHPRKYAKQAQVSAIALFLSSSIAQQFYSANNISFAVLYLRGARKIDKNVAYIGRSV